MQLINNLLTFFYIIIINFILILLIILNKFDLILIITDKFNKWVILIFKKTIFTAVK